MPLEDQLHSNLCAHLELMPFSKNIYSLLIILRALQFPPFSVQFISCYAYTELSISAILYCTVLRCTVGPPRPPVRHQWLQPLFSLVSKRLLSYVEKVCGESLENLFFFKHRNLRLHIPDQCRAALFLLNILHLRGVSQLNELTISVVPRLPLSNCDTVFCSYLQLLIILTAQKNGQLNISDFKAVIHIYSELIKILAF